ncbi:MAG TPA: PP2C family protein-serine/threonine phosphatase [Rectinemataceae bacterium]|nr:PP2C family protein-serine/threonine phosphatase [Rectinemataceae bacterium]
MNIALAVASDLEALISDRFCSKGHACLRVERELPPESDCLVIIGERPDSESLEAEAKAAELPVLRIAVEGALEAAAAAAWGLARADDYFMDAARADARVKRLEDIRVKMAEQRNAELAGANELLERRAADLDSALKLLDGANRQLIDELNLASELQKSLLPKTYPKDAPLEFAHKFIPLDKIGGDFFDVVRIDDRTLALVIADVSGHGVGPALVTAMFKSSFGLVSKTVRSPSQLMSSLNAEMNNFLTTGHYVTAFTAFIDIETLEMRYCSAGHPNQLLVRADGGAEELATMGFLLGMITDMDYEEKTLSMGPGDTLILFTDGVFESANSSGDMFGREGILRAVAKRPGAGPLELSNGLFSDLLEWTEGTEPADDITMLLAQALESL